MELFLDSAKTEEVREASSLGFLYGLTTTPTFLHREGITDVDAAILEFSRMVNILQIYLYQFQIYLTMIEIWK